MAFIFIVWDKSFAKQIYQIKFVFFSSSFCVRQRHSTPSNSNQHNISRHSSISPMHFAHFLPFAAFRLWNFILMPVSTTYHVEEALKKALPSHEPNRNEKLCKQFFWQTTTILVISLVHNTVRGSSNIKKKRLHEKAATKHPSVLYFLIFMWYSTPIQFVNSFHVC